MNGLPGWGRWAAVAAIAALGACAEVDPERIRVGIPTAPMTLDPRFASDAMSARLVRLLHRAPVGLDASANPRPDLATWEVMDPRRYRLRLVDGARFNDARPVTAADVAATYRSVLDARTASPHRGALANIEHISVVDARHLDFTLTRPDPLFPATLTVGVLAEADVAAGRVRDDWRVNSGPFERVTSRANGVTVMRRRADGQLVEFVPVKDLTVRAMQLIAGELDIIQGNLAPEIYAWLTARPELVGQQRAGTTFSYIGFNLLDAATGQVEVRRAIAHAIDREAIVDKVFAGSARIANGLFPPQHWAGARELEGIAHDPAMARRLLAQAGYGERRLRLTYKTSSDHFRLRLAAILQSQLAAVGIDLEIESHDWGTFFGDVTAGRFQLYGLSWVGLATPDIFRHAFHSASLPPAGANRGAYRSDAVDAMIEKADREPDRERRARLYRRLQARLLDDLPYVPLWFEDQLAIMRTDIRGYTIDGDGSFDALEYASRGTAHATR